MKKLILWVILWMPLTGHTQNLISLNGQWNLSFWQQPEKAAVRSPEAMQRLSIQTIPASVPGNVELDLVTARLIPDPMIGSNIWAIRPYEAYQWCYSRTFSTPVHSENQTIVLHFKGIDCLADIWLNGEKIGEVDNMFIEHSFDVTDRLKQGDENTLQVIIRSAVIEGQKYFLSTITGKGDSPNPEQLNIRKAPHSYGWDISPRLVSAGLWRDVELKVLDPVYFTDVQWITNNVNPTAKQASVTMECQLKLPFRMLDKCKIVATLSRNGKPTERREQKLYKHASSINFRINDADLWWPRGYGEPALYEAIVSVVDEQGKVLASDKKNIGLRNVSLEHTELSTLEEPGEFCFRVNGEKIFIKGTNWVPVDVLHSRDASLIPQVMDMAVELNCNMLRCWGGNVYEDHAFYDICDRNGILVWQDFSMACNIYPMDDGFSDKIKKEVLAVVVKLRNHPCIALWSGNNENDEVFNGRGGLDPNKDRISRKIIPDILFEFDPTRPYLPSSPYYTPAFYSHGRNINMLPERHLWGPRGYYKAPFYTDVNASFVSEIGYHGCPNRESLEKMFSKDCVYPWKRGTFEWNDEWQTKAASVNRYSTTTINRNNLMLNQIKELFGEVPSELDRFIFASQIVQAEAKKFFVEFWRMDKFRRTGILWWNLRDGWPLISDAVTDYWCSKKLAYYYIKQVQHDACVMIGDAKIGNHPVVAVNDTRIEKQGTVIVRDLDTKETLLSGRFVIPANGKTIVGYIPETGKQGMWTIEYVIDNHQYTNHYLAGKAPFKLNEYEKWYKQLAIKR